MSNIENQYNKLKREAREWVVSAIGRHTVAMRLYPKDRLSEGWPLADLAERVRAADQLGYNVELRWSDEGLQVRYVKKLPPTPSWYW